MRTALVVLGAGALLVSLGCSTPYVVRQLSGQVELLARARPLAEVRAESSDARVARAIDEVTAVLEFARERGFLVEDAYQTYVELDGRPLVTVVMACPPDRFEPTTWWFPVIGAFPYKGYFDREAARRSVARLTAAGLETHAGVAPAFSSLGWFPDPVYSHFLDLELGDRADLLLHELTHRTVFFPGDTRLNESLATFTARKATEIFLASRPAGDAELKRYRDDQADRDRLVAELATTRERLVEAFEAEEREVRLAAKEGLLAELRERLSEVPWRSERYRGVHRVAWTLPLLLTYDIYTGDVPLLESLWQASGEDLETFLAAMATVGEDLDAFEVEEPAPASPAD